MITDISQPLVVVASQVANAQGYIVNIIQILVQLVINLNINA
jgi:hypothetical protein